MSGNILANALLFVVGWLACILGGNSAWLLIVFLVLLAHFLFISSWAAEGKLVVSCLLAGAVLDSLMLQMGWLEIRGHDVLTPLWSALSWGLLGTTLNHALRWSAHPWWCASVLGALAGPLLYTIITQRDDVTLTVSLPVIALAWAIMLPLLHGFAHLYREQYGPVQRRR
ncbi:Protein of unknown function [Halopseudomonas litoralis]|uniref:DUF2878 domain-containing protein n=1 Tax=Halopseudomonas litoralis TaxID=797277 RepID=A0A1H1LA19_9GAMM|nr:DUF2878 domain-containing protein [Halopseudomonas litoralis]SDR70865.1 Protein of unknown function [Halopseudomonas litoralis]